MGFNHLDTIKSCGRDTGSVSCWSRCAQPGLKQGIAHRRADVAHRRAYILESTLHQTPFLGYTKQGWGEYQIYGYKYEYL